MMIEPYNKILVESLEKMQRLYRVAAAMLITGKEDPGEINTVAHELACIAREINAGLHELQLNAPYSPDTDYICPYRGCGEPVIGKNYVLLGTDRYHTVCYQRMLADGREHQELWSRVLSLEKQFEQIQAARVEEMVNRAGECVGGACKV